MANAMQTTAYYIPLYFQFTQVLFSHPVSHEILTGFPGGLCIASSSSFTAVHCHDSILLNCQWCPYAKVWILHAMVFSR